MTKEEIQQICEDRGLEDVLLADGLEEAFIGFAQQFSNVVALYDRRKCIYIFVIRDGMTEEDAEEYFDFNVVGAYVGTKTPAFAEILR